MAVLETEPAMVTHRSQVDVQHGRTRQTVTEAWTLDAGTYVLIACVTGTGSARCAERPVVVH